MKCGRGEGEFSGALLIEHILRIFQILKGSAVTKAILPPIFKFKFKFTVYPTVC